MKNNILIIGGGPAGLEAASGLQRLGYNVILIERETRLGGHLASWDRLFPDGASASAKLKELLAHMDGVKCFTDTEVQSINRLDKSYNVILSNSCIPSSYEIFIHLICVLIRSITVSDDIEM